MSKIPDYPDGSPVRPTDLLVISRPPHSPGDTFNIPASDFGTSGLIPRVATYIINGGGSVLPTGVAGTGLYFPFGATINGAVLLADQSGSVVIDVWVAPYSSYPPSDANSIVASDPPTITTAQKSKDTTLTGWTKVIPADSVMWFNVDSVTAIEFLTIALSITA